MGERNSYSQVRKYLLSTNVNSDIINHLDTLEVCKQEELANMFSAIAEDEILQILALLDKDFLKEYLRNQRLQQEQALTLVSNSFLSTLN